MRKISLEASNWIRISKFKPASRFPFLRIAAKYSEEIRESLMYIFDELLLIKMDVYGTN